MSARILLKAPVPANFADHYASVFSKSRSHLRLRGQVFHPDLEDSGYYRQFEITNPPNLQFDARYNVA